MINPDVLARATLEVGAYPRRFSDALGGQIALRLREGSRTRTAFSGSIGGVAVSATAEGPLGTSARGSWLISGRQNFLDWPTTSFASEYRGMGFGFRDVQAKAVYDVSAAQQLSVTTVAGQSVGDNGDEIGPGGVFTGRHHAALVTVGWRSVIGSATLLQQSAHLVSHRVRNADSAGAMLGQAHERGVGYRLDLAHVFPAVTLEAGGQLQRQTASRDHVTDRARAVSGVAQSGYTHFVWTTIPRVTLTSGLRVASAAFSSRVAMTP
jgi:hypothetical protein